MSNLRNDYLPCHYICRPNVAYLLTLCRMSNLKNAHVDLLRNIYSNDIQNANKNLREITNLQNFAKI